MKNALNYMVLLFMVFLSVQTVYSQSQNPDLSLTQAERDSILKHYDQLFPIWGRKVIEKGFDLPYPYGVNIIYFYMTQGINMGNFGLSFGDNPLNHAWKDVIVFKDTKTVVNTVNTRFDLWLFPFLNIYGLFGKGWSTTTVHPTIVLPDKEIPFTSEVSQSGLYYGFGFTGAIGIKKNWLSLDMNWTWTDLELLDEPVPARVTGIRYGRTIKFSKQRRMAVWVGAMHQKFETQTRGSIYLKDALPGDVINELEEYMQTPEYDNLPQWKKDLIERVVDGYNSAKINYGMDKAPESPWNMIIGVNYEHTKHWHFRVEAGLIVRYSLLLNVNYRF